MMPADSRKSQQGFTLIEVVVTLTIFAFIALLASLGIHQAALSQVRLQRLEHSARSIAGVEALLRPILSQAASPTLFRDPSVAAFEGDGQHMSFLGPIRWGVDALDLVRYSVIFDPRGALRLRWAFDQSLGNGEGASGEQALIEHAEGAQFAYLADGAAPVPENWDADWRRPGELPKLVRLTLRSDGVTTELVFALLRFRLPCKTNNTAGGYDSTC